MEIYQNIGIHLYHNTDSVACGSNIHKYKHYYIVFYIYFDIYLNKMDREKKVEIKLKEILIQIFSSIIYSREKRYFL